MKSDKLSGFGRRLLEAFGEMPKGAIAIELGVAPSTITDYLQHRVPDDKTLIRISDITKCSIHWLITGQGEKSLNPAAPRWEKGLEDRMHEIALDVFRQEISKIRPGARRLKIDDSEEGERREGAA